MLPMLHSADQFRSAQTYVRQVLYRSSVTQPLKIKVI
jgi:hypothetical protein